jgi:hypothetical protein
MSRLISLPLHSAIEIGLATAVMTAPFIFGLGPAALVTSVSIGALLMGLALGGSGSGRGSIPVAAHAAYDGGIAIGLVLAGVLLGIAGDGSALIVLAAAGLLQVALTASTRYTAPPTAGV